MVCPQVLQKLTLLVNMGSSSIYVPIYIYLPTSTNVYVCICMYVVCTHMHCRKLISKATWALSRSRGESHHALLLGTSLRCSDARSGDASQGARTRETGRRPQSVQALHLAPCTGSLNAGSRLKQAPGMSMDSSRLPGPASLLRLVRLLQLCWGCQLDVLWLFGLSQAGRKQGS